MVHDEAERDRDDGKFVNYGEHFAKYRETKRSLESRCDIDFVCNRH